MKLKLDPTKLLVLILALFALGAIVVNDFKSQILLHLAATLGFGLVLFMLFTIISKQNKNILNTIITCLILFLVLHYTSVTYALIATFITIFAKFFIEYNGSPIVNPTVLAILVIQLITNIIPGLPLVMTSWWGVSYNFAGVPITLILIAIWALFGLYKWRKLPIFFSYLIFYAALFAVFYREFDTLKIIFTNSTIYFFTAVMLVEPKTSPFLKSQQIIYGILAAIVSVGLTFVNIPISNLVAIAVPNLYYFGVKMMRNRKN